MSEPQEPRDSRRWGATYLVLPAPPENRGRHLLVEVHQVRVDRQGGLVLEVGAPVRAAPVQGAPEREQAAPATPAVVTATPASQSCNRQHHRRPSRR